MQYKYPTNNLYPEKHKTSYKPIIKQTIQLKNGQSGTSLVRLRTANAGGLGSNPGQGTR